jgi:RNA recognition motif-containing protein
MNNIFVGNLSFKATKEDVIKLFEPFGRVANAVIMERKKGKSRGYGFVDMPNEEEKSAAIAALEGKEFMWRVLSVSPVIPKVKREVKSERESKRWSKPKPASGAKSWSKPASGPKPESTSEGRLKYHNKIDGPSKPWRKVNSKPVHNKNKGSRPYYGKSDREFKADDRQSKPYRSEERPSRPSGSKLPFKKFESPSKPLAKGKGGFKMRHKVSGAPKSWPKKGPTKTLSDFRGSKE